MSKSPPLHTKQRWKSYKSKKSSLHKHLLLHQLTSLSSILPAGPHALSIHCSLVVIMSKLARSNTSEAKVFHTDSGTLVRGKFLWFRELGSRKFLVLQRYKGLVKLHLRNYVLEEEEYVLVPTKRGVVLDKQQTRDLLCALPELSKVIKNVSFTFKNYSILLKQHPSSVLL